MGFSSVAAFVEQAQQLPYGQTQQRRDAQIHRRRPAPSGSPHSAAGHSVVCAPSRSHLPLFSPPARRGARADDIQLLYYNIPAKKTTVKSHRVFTAEIFL